MADYPIRFPEDRKRIYLFPVNEPMSMVFKPGWVIDRVWIDNGTLGFIAGPEDADG